MKHAQEIFARADGEVEHASAGAPFVVEEGERIVQVGATEQYEIKFTESDGPSLPVVFKRHSCSELTYVHSVGKDMAMKKGRDQLVRTQRGLFFDVGPLRAAGRIDGVVARPRRLAGARLRLTCRAVLSCQLVGARPGHASTTVGKMARDAALQSTTHR